MFCCLFDNLKNFCPLYFILKQFSNDSLPDLKTDISVEDQNSSNVNTNSIKVGPISTRVKCTNCGLIVNTTTSVESSMQTHIVAAMLIATIFCWMCPYLCKGCKNVHHYCPHCEQYLDTYRR